MTAILEQRIVTLETQLKDVKATLFKYENRLRDQKLFCDCVAKYFLHKFGFDIWLQLDMLKSALEDNNSTDSEGASLFPKRISKLISNSRKRHGKQTYGEQRPVRPRLEALSASRVGEATSSGMPVAPISATVQNSTPKQPEKDIITDAAGTSTATTSPTDLIDVDSSDENSGAMSKQHHQPMTVPINPRELVKCESEFYDESGDADNNYGEAGADEILGGINFENFAETSQHRVFSGSHHSVFGERKQKTRRRNPVWAHFNIFPNKLVCKFPGCLSELKGVVTTNAKKHLQHHHPELWQQVAFEEQLMLQRAAANAESMSDNCF